ncbi:MAG TPA: cytochrome b [Tahibacter sp.]|nr:cytochrome b [Tahibacter sp.]
MNATTTRYSRLVRALHWTSVVAIATAYALVELRGYVPRGTPERAAMMQWHMALGLLVLLLVLPRIGIALARPAPPIVPPLSRAVHLAAKATHVALYIFLIVQPLLGVILVQAGERAITLPLVGWQLPALIGADHDLHENAEEIHETLGKVFYFVIGAHILAALWHHFGAKDDTLKRMLP